MNSRNVLRAGGNVKFLSAALGIGTVLTMGALTATQTNAQADASVKPLTATQATVTSTTAEPTLKVAFAEPTVVAVPCAKRATYPC